MTDDAPGPIVEPFGREPELDRVDAALDAIETRGTALAVVGDPGVGKSALLSAIVDHALARDMRVLSASGAEAEGHLPFATLHQLLGPILERSGELPGGHRSALHGALGIIDDEVTSRQLFVALGALELIAGCGSGPADTARRRRPAVGRRGKP